MAEQLGNEEVVLIEDVVISHAYEMIGLITVLEKKGILTRQEIIAEIEALKKQN